MKFDVVYSPRRPSSGSKWLLPLSQFKTVLRHCSLFCEIVDVQFGLLCEGSLQALLMSDAGGDTPLSGLV